MPINKIDFSGKNLIDLTADTVNAANLAEGKTAHDKAGNIIVGTMKQQGGIPAGFLQRMIYVGNFSVPASSLGSDGDIFLRRG